jgi:predicted DNA-binding transcriptional regulator AlpA
MTFSARQDQAMSQPTTTADANKLLSIKQVARRYGVARSTVWRWEATGLIPRGLRISRGTVRWLAAEIENHLASCR